MTTKIPAPAPKMTNAVAPLMLIWHTTFLAILKKKICFLINLNPKTHRPKNKLLYIHNLFIYSRF